MNRAEHLAWAKARAIKYLEQNNWDESLASFLSDMRKHEELAAHPGLELMSKLVFGGHLSTASELRTYIEGFK